MAVRIRQTVIPFHLLKFIVLACKFRFPNCWKRIPAKSNIHLSPWKSLNNSAGVRFQTSSKRTLAQRMKIDQGRQTELINAKGAYGGIWEKLRQSTFGNIHPRHWKSLSKSAGVRFENLWKRTPAQRTKIDQGYQNLRPNPTHDHT